MRVRIVQSVDEAEHNKAREAQTDKHEADDLAAQQKAADAAAVAATAADRQVDAAIASAVLALAATIIAGVGTYYLIRTFQEAKRTADAAADGVKEAARAAKAAEDAVAVATNSAERQLRAYVFVKDAPISPIVAGERIECQVIIENAGATPAYDFVVYGKMSFAPYPLREDLPPLDFETLQYSKDVVGPGGIRNKWERPGVPLDDLTETQIKAGTHAIFVHGKIRYRDAFDRRRYTRYRLFIGGDNQGATLSAHEEGNEAN